jgi:hypothetical protein
MEFGAMIYFNCANDLIRERQSQSLLRLILQHLKEKGKCPSSDFLQSGLSGIHDAFVTRGVEKIMACPSDFVNQDCSAWGRLSGENVTNEKPLINHQSDVLNGLWGRQLRLDTAWRLTLEVAQYLKAKFKVTFHGISGMWGRSILKANVPDQATARRGL